MHNNLINIEKQESETVAKPTSRDNSIDILKGIGIFCVILGHSALPIPYLHKFIYSFHMPLFIIVSGYFYNSLKYSIKKDFKRMMLPYFFTCLLILLLKLIYDQGDILNWLLAVLWGSSSVHNPGLWGQMPNVGVVWFLLALFTIRFIYQWMERKLSTKLLSITLLLLFLFAALVRNYISLPFSLLASFAGLLFFHIGVIVRRNEYFHKPVNYILLILGGIVWLFCLKFSTIDVGKCAYKYFYLDVMAALFILYVLKKGSEYLALHFKRFSKFWTYLGTYSMVILCFHDVDLKMIAPFVAINAYLYVLLQILFCILCVEIVRRNKFLSYIFET